MIMKVADILKSKGNNVWSVTENITVYEALKMMGEKNVGALIVMDGEKLKGIISERDYARKIILKGKSSSDTQVKDIMTEDVITVLPEDEIEKCMGLMSGRKIRHLPVVKDDKVMGIISITDVVTAIIDLQKNTIAHLQNYISQ
jgi:CBS domain-containing protein